MRYYLVPFDTPYPSGGQRPKYLADIGVASGVISVDIANKHFYIVKIADDLRDMSALEAHNDVRPLDPARLRYQHLVALGITGVDANSTQDELEKALCEWLVGERRTLRTL
jgi:hypothetical protein